MSQHIGRLNVIQLNQLQVSNMKQK